jgi:hypothetical protein
MPKQKPRKDNTGPAGSGSVARAFPIEWYVPDELATLYANNIVVQRTDHEFFLYFFDAQPPLLIGPPEAIRTAAEQIESVKARCVARIVVARERMSDFVKVLETNLIRAQGDEGAEE